MITRLVRVQQQQQRRAQTLTPLQRHPPSAQSMQRTDATAGRLSERDYAAIFATNGHVARGLASSSAEIHALAEGLRARHLAAVVATQSVHNEGGVVLLGSLLKIVASIPAHPTAASAFRSVLFDLDRRGAVLPMAALVPDVAAARSSLLGAMVSAAVAQGELLGPQGVGLVARSLGGAWCNADAASDGERAANEAVLALLECCSGCGGGSGSGSGGGGARNSAAASADFVAELWEGVRLAFAATPESRRWLRPATVARFVAAVVAAPRGVVSSAFALSVVNCVRETAAARCGDRNATGTGDAAAFSDVIRRLLVACRKADSIDTVVDVMRHIRQHAALRAVEASHVEQALLTMGAMSDAGVSFSEAGRESAKTIVTDLMEQARLRAATAFAPLSPPDDSAADAMETSLSSSSAAPSAPSSFPLQRLGEVLRISAKIFYRSRDFAFLANLWSRSPRFVGVPWQVAAAQVELDGPDSAWKGLALFHRFLCEARRHFAHGLPDHVRTAILRAVQMAAASASATPSTVALPALNTKGGVTEGVSAGRKRRRVLQEAVQMAASWGIPNLPPAVVLEQAVRGMLGAVPEDAAGGVTRKAARRPLTTIVDVVARHRNLLTTRTADAIFGALAGADPGHVMRVFLRLYRALGEDNRGVSAHLVNAALGVLLQRGPVTHSSENDNATTIEGDDDGSDRIRADTALAFFDRYGDKLPVPGSLSNARLLLARLPAAPTTRTPAKGAKVDDEDRVPMCEDEATTRRRSRLVALVSAAEDKLEANRRISWSCPGCGIWNAPGTKFCKVCQAADVALWRCPVCTGFSPATKTACVVCGVGRLVLPVVTPAAATPVEAVPKEGNGEEPEKFPASIVASAVIALRPWDCSGCGRSNSAHAAFYCPSCKAPTEVMKTVDPYVCVECGHSNAAGIVRPWCQKCGSLHAGVVAAATTGVKGGSPVGATAPGGGGVATAAVSPSHCTLWQCPSCCHLNPWVVGTCNGCRDTLKPSDDAAHEVAWHQWGCEDCGQQCPAWVSACTACLSPRTGIVSSSAMALLPETCGGSTSVGGRENDPFLLLGDASSASTAWFGTSLPRCDVCGARHAPFVTKCAVCSSPCDVAATRESVWMCLSSAHGGRFGTGVCMHLNDIGVHNCSLCGHGREVGEVSAGARRPRSAAAARDGVVRAAAFLAFEDPQQCEGSEVDAEVSPLSVTTSSDVLGGYIQPPPADSDVKVADSASSSNTGLVAAAGGVAWSTAPSDNLPRVPVPPKRRLVVLDVTHRPCTLCGCWLEGSNVCRVCPDCGFVGAPDAATVPVAAWLLLRTAEVLCARLVADPQRCDAAGGGAALLSQLVLRFVSLDRATLPWRGRDVARGICCPSPAIPVFDDDTPHAAIVLARHVVAGLARLATMTIHSADTQRAALAAAVSLVDCCNATTEFDELGFDVVAALCMALRPHQQAHIRHETRLQYLLHAKLQRSDLTNGEVCDVCFGVLPGALSTTTSTTEGSAVQNVGAGRPCVCARPPSSSMAQPQRIAEPSLRNAIPCVKWGRPAPMPDVQRTAPPQQHSTRV